MHFACILLNSSNPWKLIAGFFLVSSLMITRVVILFVRICGFFRTCSFNFSMRIGRVPLVVGCSLDVFWQEGRQLVLYGKLKVNIWSFFFVFFRWFLCRSILLIRFCFFHHFYDFKNECPTWKMLKEFSTNLFCVHGKILIIFLKFLMCTVGFATPSFFFCAKFFNMSKTAETSFARMIFISFFCFLGYLFSILCFCFFSNSFAELHLHKARLPM